MAAYNLSTVLEPLNKCGGVEPQKIQTRTGNDLLLGGN
jgi:hypothetical protein